MPYLYCEKHGAEHEVKCAAEQSEDRQADETILIVTGTLVSGPWCCDRCNVPLRKGDTAYLLSVYPSHCRDDLCDYDFGYERQYFAMNASDRANAYGAEWPDDSIRKRRKGNYQPRPASGPLCALDLKPGR